jgi:hypothetical protein
VVIKPARRRDDLIAGLRTVEAGENVPGRAAKVADEHAVSLAQIGAVANLAHQEWDWLPDCRDHPGLDAQSRDVDRVGGARPRTRRYGLGLSLPDLVSAREGDSDLWRADIVACRTQVQLQRGARRGGKAGEIEAPRAVRPGPVLQD